jgi:hypothetical protein
MSGGGGHRLTGPKADIEVCPTAASLSMRLSKNRAVRIEPARSQSDATSGLGFAYLCNSVFVDNALDLLSVVAFMIWHSLYRNCYFMPSYRSSVKMAGARLLGMEILSDFEKIKISTMHRVQRILHACMSKSHSPILGQTNK